MDKTIIITEEQFNIIENIATEEDYEGFHGSPSGDIVTGKFKKGKRGYMGPGIYFGATKDYVQRYAKQYGSGTIYTVRIRLYNPLMLSSREPTEEMLTAIYGSPSVYKRRAMKQANDVFIITSKDIKKMFDKGYDGVIWEWNDYKEYVLYDNSQIEILEKEEV